VNPKDGAAWRSLSVTFRIGCPLRLRLIGHLYPFGTVWVLTGLHSWPFSTGDTTNHPDGLLLVTVYPTAGVITLDPMLRHNEEVGTLSRPYRDASRGIADWPLRYSPLLGCTGYVGNLSFDQRFLYEHGLAQVGFDMRLHISPFYIYID
jgi:hypothetical protein